MKIKDIIKETPEMSEDRLLRIIEQYSPMFKKEASKRIIELYNRRHNFEFAEFPVMLLEEYDLIQDKKSNLTKSQRDQIEGFVGLCMIQMTKNGDTSNN